VRALWPLAAMSLVGLGAYLPILEIDRYLGGFTLLLYLVLLAAVRLRPEGRRAAAYVTAAVFATMTLAMIDYTGRLVTHHVPAFQGVGPTSALPDVLAAEQLGAMVRPGTKIAIVGAGDTAFWAHLAKLRIVAETVGPDEFWAASEETRQKTFIARLHGPRPSWCSQGVPSIRPKFRPAGVASMGPRTVCSPCRLLTKARHPGEGSSFFRLDWANAVNAYWSPL
jgi:hypothetical protein